MSAVDFGEIHIRISACACKYIYNYTHTPAYIKVLYTEEPCSVMNSTRIEFRPFHSRHMVITTHSDPTVT
jgi:hypothetical protein